MTDVTVSLVVGLVLATVLALATPLILRALPPPEDAALGWSYATACTGWFAPIVGVTSGITLVGALCRAPPGARPAWAVLATLGVLLAGIDARTGYLPKRLCWVAIALAAVAVGVGATVTGDWTMPVTSAAAGALGWAILLLVWRLSRSLGFGDVRLAGLVGLVAGTIGVTQALGGIAVGAVLAAVAGVVRAFVTRRAASYPFGPFLVAGPFVVLMLC